MQPGRGRRQCGAILPFSATADIDRHPCQRDQPDLPGKACQLFGMGHDTGQIARRARRHGAGQRECKLFKRRADDLRGRRLTQFLDDLREFLQFDATASNLAAAITPLLADTPDRARAIADLDDLRRIMGVGGPRPSLLAARAVLEML